MFIWSRARMYVRMVDLSHTHMQICFGCRQRGHVIDDCPEAEGAGMCFKCGSGDHTVKQCNAKLSAGNYAYVPPSCV